MSLCTLKLSTKSHETKEITTEDYCHCTKFGYDFREIQITQFRLLYIEGEVQVAPSCLNLIDLINRDSLTIVVFYCTKSINLILALKPLIKP